MYYFCHVFSESRDYMPFIKLQHSIDMDYIAEITNVQPDVTIQIGSMPYMRGGYFQNEAGITFGFLFPIFFIVLLDSTFIVPLVEEKQDGLQVCKRFGFQLNVNNVIYLL